MTSPAWPLAVPEPKPGCATCAHLCQLRRQAQATGDGSATSDANVRLRRHFAEDHSDT
ncbi:hypothetical protein [Streptomyces spiramyceticus]|uniref:hypothetical protein n=1 Tax=Streptomyces spiramyceticus TaxID=299717 RepID=UPI00237B367E|nr:hypothetical protein [Streptomyces spiramyceticus]